MIVSEKFTKSISDAGPTVIMNLRDFTLYPIRSVIPNPASLKLKTTPKYRQYQPFTPMSSPMTQRQSDKNCCIIVSDFRHIKNYDVSVYYA